MTFPLKTIGFFKSVVGFDSDAQAFITAAVITDTTQQNAINTLVVALKSASLWSKFKAIYPIVGGTSNSHKYNLIDPRDLDAAYRLTYSTALTHSSTGMTSASNGYCDTNCLVAAMPQNSIHLSFYSRTAVGNGALMGNSLLNYCWLTSQYGATTAYVGLNSSNSSVTNGSSDAFFINSRIGATTQFMYKNASKLITSSISSSGINSGNLWLLARNDPSPAPTPQECAFASLGDGLTDADCASLYSIVQTYQASLGRDI